MTLPNRQSGAALMVGLILLVVMSMLGLSALRGTTLQGKMASGFQFKEIAFQAADEGVRTTMMEARGDIDPPDGSSNILVESINVDESAGETPPTRTLTDSAAGTDVTATTAYQNFTEAPGFSLGVGKGVFVAHQYRVTSAATGPDPAATSNIQQGISRVGPAAN